MRNQLVAFNPRRSTMALAAKAIAPAIARKIAQSAANAAWRNAPSYEEVGGAFRKLKNGYSRNSAPLPMMSTVSTIAPVAVSNPRVTRAARIVSGKKSTTITHREMINGAITGSTTWTATTPYNLQPGDPVTFPWLSTIASQYSQYTFKSLVFEYVPFCPTSTQGDIILTPDYDSSNSAPTSEVIAVDHKDSIIDTVWKDIRCVLNPRDLHSLGPRRYVRSYNVAGDIKTYDCGTLMISTNNCTGSSSIGKLFVSYSVELFTPVLESTLAQPSTAQQYTKTVSQAFLNATPSTILWDATPTGNLGILQSTGVFLLPKGMYKITYSISAKDTSSEVFTLHVQAYLNGVLLNTGSTINNTNTPAPFLTNTGSLFVRSAGGDSFLLSVTLSGAAGTLTTVTPTYNNLIFELV